MGLQMCVSMDSLFTWILGDQTQVLTLVRQVLSAPTISQPLFDLEWYLRACVRTVLTFRFENVS